MGRQNVRLVAGALLVVIAALAQEAPRVKLAPLPAPLGMPKPGLSGDGPYAPMPILPGGVVVPLYPYGFAVPEDGARGRGGAVQYEPVRAGADQQHREYP